MLLLFLLQLQLSSLFASAVRPLMFPFRKQHSTTKMTEAQAWAVLVGYVGAKPQISDQILTSHDAGGELASVDKYSSDNHKQTGRKQRPWGRGVAR